MVGRILGGRHRLVARVGSGGMSSIYMARHVALDRPVAIKVLRRDLAADPVQRDRFLREARAAGRINHRNIVEIMDFGESEDGLLYLVMEYVNGTSLFTALGEAPFPARRALHIAAQVASALARAHQMGVVHRDLKPENILLTEREGDPDFVKVHDFGIAKILDAPSLTGSQQIFGTPGYIAPEYIQSADIDGRSDLYSLGVILYEMVTGALPFDYEYPGDLLVKHVSEEPIAPRVRHPLVEPAVEELLLRCLRKKPDARFRDAHHFLSELVAVCADLGLDVNAPAGDAVRSRRPPRPVGPGVAGTEEASGAGDPFDVAGWCRRADEAHREIRRGGGDLAEAEQTMAFVTRTAAELQASLAACADRQARIAAVEDQARDTRATLGRAMDDLARRLSRARGELEQAEMRRTEVGRLLAVARARSGHSADEADGLLWKLADAEEAVQAAVRVCREQEDRLGRASRQLASEDERLEVERARLVRWVDREMLRAESMAAALRDGVVRLESLANRVRSGHRETPS